jgi:hypothetical protein
MDHESVDHERAKEAWSTMLTNVQIRALKPQARPYKVPDTDGLFLLVQPTGALLWRFRFKVFCTERKLSLGTFPTVTLQQARKKRDEARAQLIDGIDPVQEKQQKRLEAELAAKTTFQLVAEEYIQKMEREGKSPATIKKARWFLELLDGIASRPIASVTPHELLDGQARRDLDAMRDGASRDAQAAYKSDQSLATEAANGAPERARRACCSRAKCAPIQRDVRTGSCSIGTSSRVSRSVPMRQATCRGAKPFGARWRSEFRSATAHWISRSPWSFGTVPAACKTLSRSFTHYA